LAEDVFLSGTRGTLRRAEREDPALIRMCDLLAVPPMEQTERERVIHSVLSGLQRADYYRKAGAKTELDYRSKLECLTKLLDRSVPCETVNFDERSEDEVSTAIEVFRRLNKGGKGLSSGDIAAASLARTQTEEVLPLMRRFMSTPIVRLLGLNFVIATRTLATVHKGSPRFTTSDNRYGESTFWNNNSAGHSVKYSWKKAETALTEVLEVIVRETGWTTRRWLPSGNALVPLAFLVSRRTGRRKLSQPDRRNVVRYLCLSALAKAFSGSSETDIAAFVARVKKAELNGEVLNAELLLGSLPIALT